MGLPLRRLSLPFHPSFFSRIKNTLRGVFGNNDGDKFRHLAFKQKWGIDLEYEERFLEMEIDKRQVAVFHGDYSGIVEALVTCGKYDVVFYGHTHQKVNQYHGKTLSLNPGLLMQETSKEVKGASIAIYATETPKAKHILL